MKRRDFLALSSGAAAVWPVMARAQSRRIPTVGVLWHAGSADEEAIYLSALRAGFAALGYVEGQNIVLEHRFPNEIPERFVSYATELAAMPLDALIAITQLAALAAQRATTTIPIIFVTVADPVGAKLVNSIARPGGNISGFTHISIDLSAKRLALFKEAIPHVERIGVLVNPADQQGTRRALDEFQKAGKALKLDVQPLEIRSTSDIEPAFGKILEKRLDGIVQGPSSLFYQNRALLANLAIQHRVPLMPTVREAVEAGGLMSYAPDIRAIFRRAPEYIDKILKGANVADLPVQEPTRYELLINLKTAKAIGLNIAETFLVRADGIVE